MGAFNIFENPSGPGIGAHPLPKPVRLRMREADAVKGKVYLLDIFGSDAGGDVSGSEAFSSVSSGFANVVPNSPAANRELRLGIFVTPLEDIEEDQVGNFAFSGGFGFAAGGVAAEANPEDGLFVIAASGDVGAGRGLIWDAAGNLEPDDLGPTSGNLVKVIGRNHVLQTTPTTAQKSVVTFDGIHGFGFEITP